MGVLSCKQWILLLAIHVPLPLEGEDILLVEDRRLLREEDLLLQEQEDTAVLHVVLPLTAEEAPDVLEDAALHLLTDEEEDTAVLHAAALHTAEEEEDAPHHTEETPLTKS